MPESIRYNQLHHESKHFQNIIKMICYRAESSFANLLAHHYKKSINEKRTLVKNIINRSIDLEPDYENNILTVKLYTLPTPRDNQAVLKIIDTLNQTQTCFPGTNFILNYKTATSHPAASQEFCN